ncbi:cyclopropane fatty-acyl-phospholipid synthase-like methyltransferase [Aminobacter niigataensis]|uniref:Cyclopropane fatty-acyl-phospholipid synthase-like methyltransferase n=1 Tax=Aminobacter niigataensis TaxID=83265 RepID=A0ABR6L237_9HYPH|nr:class I SAM-dependent methyltransferase [Aminobacter niigataensis]MBB4650831.1 cyclopropane fatty-acyl-phospholipid synthase-like methyltransferase [Aminobacter niigataensis]
MAIPQRIAWSIGHLEVEPGDRLLEIGCGRGVAMAEIAPLLVDGHITGLDRSGSAVNSAEERVRASIASGKAALFQAALADWSGPGHAFGKVFAINVSLFWLEAARELKVISSLLTPGGRLFLFFEPPSAGQIPTIEHAIAVRLKAAGYTLERTMYGPSPKPPLLGMVASPPA